VTMQFVSAAARAGDWLDTDQPLSDAVLTDIAAAGYEGVWRYVPLPNNPSLLDISAGELSRICAAGLQCGLIQHPRSPAYNRLPDHDPELDARTAVSFALAAGYPEGCHLGLDFEGLLGTEVVAFTCNTPSVCVQWAGFWQTVAREGGYRALLYVGYDVPLNASELFMLPGFDSYWSDAGHRAVATRGCAIAQGAKVTIHGVKFDRDVLAPDLLGDVPMVCQAA
jgi:hypothetical protein